MKSLFGISLAWMALCGLYHDCSGLKDVSIDVPSAVIQGHKAILYCYYDLEGDNLYSVKWYRGVAEFFRFSPSEQKVIKTFPIRGFHVIESESNSTQVVLRHVTRLISGKFSCEVTTETPGFFTDIKTANMEVVQIPKNDPNIIGLKSRYRVGDFVKGNCSSEKSNPAANLTWYVNGRQVDNTHVHKYKSLVDPHHVSSTITLRIQAKEHMFEKGKMKIRCSASMFDVYHRSSEKSVELEKRHRAAFSREETTTDDPPVRQIGYRNSDSQLIFQDTNTLSDPEAYNYAKLTKNEPYIMLLLILILIFQR